MADQNGSYVYAPGNQATNTLDPNNIYAQQKNGTGMGQLNNMIRALMQGNEQYKQAHAGAPPNPNMIDANSGFSDPNAQSGSAGNTAPIPAPPSGPGPGTGGMPLTPTPVQMPTSQGGPLMDPTAGQGIAPTSPSAGPTGQFWPSSAGGFNPSSGFNTYGASGGIDPMSNMMMGAPQTDDAVANALSASPNFGM